MRRIQLESASERAQLSSKTLHCSNNICEDLCVLLKMTFFHFYKVKQEKKLNIYFYFIFYVTLSGKLFFLTNEAEAVLEARLLQSESPPDDSTEGSQRLQGGSQ